MTPDQKRFVKEVEALEKSRLVERLYSGTTISVKTTGNWNTPIFPGLDEEELRSFMLTARLLTQVNDRISIRNIAASFDMLPIDNPRWRKVNAARDKLNDYLDQTACFVDFNGKSYKNREILDVFLYGCYAHTNKSHEETLERWVEEPKVFFPFKLEFLMALRVIYEAALEIKMQIKTN